MGIKLLKNEIFFFLLLGDTKFNKSPADILKRAAYRLSTPIAEKLIHILTSRMCQYEEFFVNISKVFRDVNPLMFLFQYYTNFDFRLIILLHFTNRSVNKLISIIKFIKIVQYSVIYQLLETRC